MHTKICTKCAEEKRLDDYYPSRSNKSGLANICKTCDNKGSVERSRNHVPTRSPVPKACNTCLEIKSVDQFFSRKASPDGLAYACKDCDSARRKANKLVDPEKESAYQREYRLRNLEERRKSNRNYYFDNKESFLKSCSARYERDKEKISKTAKKYYALKKPDFVARARTRKISKRRATPAWADVEAIKEIYRQCEEISIATGIRHHVDHEIPLQGELVCGLHVHNNLRIVPAVENLKKSNKFEVA